jgi:branched-chain amino acid transport system ATP-binding protein
MSRGKERATDILRFVGLEAKKNSPVHDLVAAEMKRLELARALAVGPKLLLLDEVFSGLNETETQEAINLIFRIRNDLEITIFLIEHVMKAVMGTCEKIIVMQYGVKLTEGIPEDIAKNPDVIKAYLGRKHA